MNRRDKLLSGLRLDRSVGIEIGALAKPLVRRAEGEIIYVDHMDTAGLREKYRDHAVVDVDAIVQVDAVWGPQTIQEALGPERRVDYVIASHVVEHVPDLVGWLGELESVLRPGGTIRLAVPDKRFCFDYLRAETQLTDVLVAHLLKARAPGVREIVDSEIHHRDVDVAEAWAGAVDLAALPGPDQLRHAFGVAEWSRHGEYVDVHCWTFTPRSFARVMQQLGALGLTRLACDRCFDTEPNEHEFFVIMAAAEPDRVADSWAAVLRDLPAPPGQDASGAWLAQRTRVAELEAQLQAARHDLAALRASASWRVTAPLRRIVERVRRR